MVREDAGRHAQVPGRLIYGVEGHLFVCRQVCGHDHGSRGGVVELQVPPFFACWHVCRPAGERVRQQELWYFLKPALYAGAGMVPT